MVNALNKHSDINLPTEHGQKCPRNQANKRFDAIKKSKTSFLKIRTQMDMDRSHS